MTSSKPIYGLRNNGEQHGDVFTLPCVVSFILDKVGYSANRDLRHIRILEPACGDGEFVIEIARRLILSAERFHFDAKEAFRRNVVACDIDSEKIEKCRQRIGKLGLETNAENIQVTDFLKTYYEKVDVVVGNPPYIRYENIPADMLDFCRYTFHTFHYRCDLYVPFFEKTLSMLRPGGLHCFICSNRWLKNEYGKKLRQLIARRYRLHSILNIEHANAFQEEVLAYPAITLISAEKPGDKLEYAEYSNVENLYTQETCKRNMPKDADWTNVFCNIPPSPSFMTIEQQGFKIGIGVATGADTVFVSRDLPKEVEAELIMPGINARDLRGDRFNWQGEYLLNPYNPDGTLVDLTRYPRASAYLEKHRERLLARHIAKKSPSRWYKTIDRISPTLRSQPKVLLPDMSGNSFVFVDDGEYYPLHNIYYIVGPSSVQLRLLASFLMSDFVRSQLSSVTNQMNGGFSRWQSQHLRKLRLPILNAIPSEDVQQILLYYKNKDIIHINDKIKNYLSLA